MEIKTLGHFLHHSFSASCSLFGRVLVNRAVVSSLQNTALDRAVCYYYWTQGMQSKAIVDNRSCDSELESRKYKAEAEIKWKGDFSWGLDAKPLQGPAPGSSAPPRRTAVPPSLLP